MTEDWDVLVLDDEAVVCAGARRILEAAGYRVATAGDAQTALAHPAARTCGVALCDLILPDGSGVDVVRELHSRRPDRPIIVITGYGSPEALDRAASAGATAFLTKPFDGEELLRAVRDALSGRHDSPSQRSES